MTIGEQLERAFTQVDMHKRWHLEHQHPEQCPWDCGNDEPYNERDIFGSDLGASADEY